MKFLHIADLHANKQRLEPCLKVLEKIKDYIINNSTSKDNAPPLLIAGDFFDNTITNTENSGFSSYINKMEEIKNLTDVYMVGGTPFHEPKGCLQVFKSMGITVFDEPGFIKTDKYRIFGIPEPRKSDYSAKNMEELKAAILNNLRNTIDNFKTEKKSHSCPINILMYHGEITGAKYQNGVPVSSTSYALPAEWIKELNLDYTACGHIHMPQKIEAAGECYYSGSCYPTNYGESHIAGMNIVEVN